MKINYKNTALGLIDDPKKFTFGFPDPDITPNISRGKLLNFAYSIIDNSQSLKELCGHNIQYVSKPFWDAYARGRHKLRDIFDKEEFEEGGVLIIPGGPGITHTYYYYVKTYFTKGGVWAYDMLFMDFNKRNTAEHEDGPALDVYLSSINKDDKHFTYKSLIWNGHIRQGRDTEWFEALILTFVLFKKYCDIETKVIEPKRKGVVAGSKYINETDKRITVLDSTWFTNLVVTGAFNVGGHLRWQPYGPGLAQKKIIWISDYTKEGYTRKAKALTQNENNNTHG